MAATTTAYRLLLSSPSVVRISNSSLRIQRRLISYTSSLYAVSAGTTSSVRSGIQQGAANATAAANGKLIDLSVFPPERVRNFGIIAHIDHGKSTLADRLLEMTGTIAVGSARNQQVLDTLEVERDRGITVKAQTASMVYTHQRDDGTKEDYLLNLIDTPGHVDFSYEVSRSLSACQGAVLLVDAVQGVQAQTVANFFLAFEQDLTILPCLNKIDLSHAEPEIMLNQMNNAFDIDPNEVLQISAKSGLNVDKLFPRIVSDVRAPLYRRDDPLRMLLFDSWYDNYQGCICVMELLGGRVKRGDRVRSVANGNRTFEVIDVGLLQPQMTPSDALYAGQVGYLSLGMKTTKEALVGDTFYREGVPVEPLPGFKKSKPMVFAGLYPEQSGSYEAMSRALDHIRLTDNSVSLMPEQSPALGAGWRIGFLGMLHMDVFVTRLEQDYGQPALTTSPSVPYQCIVHGSDDERLTVENPENWPAEEDIVESFEPMVYGTIIFPKKYMGAIMSLCDSRRGIMKDTSFIDENRTVLKYELPLAEVVTDFYNELKSITSGYASFDYEDHGYRSAPIKRISIQVNKVIVSPLTSLVHKNSAIVHGKRLCTKLKENIDRIQIEIAIQALMGNKIIARESIRAYRKDVTAKLYGGDQTRKQKLLNKQKEGKKRMQTFGQVNIPKEAFITAIASSQKKK